MSKLKQTKREWRPAPWGRMEAVVSVRIPAEEIARLKPEQAKALMNGLADVLSAAKHTPGASQCEN